jgi:diacylglycerol kinase (ATP)
MRVTLMHNPRAGHGGPSDDELVKLLKKADYKVDYQSTRKKKWKKALAEPGDLVVVAGGDGTVGKVVKELAGREVPVAILPMGTANNIARSLGIEGTPDEVIAGWRSGESRVLDVGTVRGPWGGTRFVEAVGFGLFTHSMALVEAREERDEPGSREEELQHDLKFLVKTLAATRSRHWGVTLDGQDLSEAYFLLEVQNIPYIGPNVCLAPDADPGDGRLDVVLLGEGERHGFAGYMQRRIQGETGALHYPVLRGEEVRIRWDGSPVRIDDEIHADVSIDTDAEAAIVEVRLDHTVPLLVGKR